jgi:hypothetical protein
MLRWNDSSVARLRQGISGKIRVLEHKAWSVAVQQQSFQRSLAVDDCDDHVAMPRRQAAVDREKVPVKNSRPGHRMSADPPQNGAGGLGAKSRFRSIRSSI